MKTTNFRMFILALALAVAYSVGCQSTSVAVKGDSQIEPEATVSPLPTESPTPEQEIKEAGLVELTRLDSSIKLDIRYATTNNFVGRVIYKEARAFMQRPAADALVRIHRKLKEQGFGLVIYDGYRPLSATRIFWEVTPPNKKQFVANPATGSRHNRGCAVDLSLFDLKTGENVDMPTEYDDFSARAAIDYAGATETQKKNRAILRSSMEADGFKVLSNEWWHFDYQACPESRNLNIEFEEIK